VGQADLDTCQRHLQALQRLGVEGASVSCEGYRFSPSELELFRSRYGQQPGATWEVGLAPPGSKLGALPQRSGGT
jgi:phospholipase/lecithinase/hemolysin